jgi:hypothetical protein
MSGCINLFPRVIGGYKSQKRSFTWLLIIAPVTTGWARTAVVEAGWRVC